MVVDDSSEFRESIVLALSLEAHFSNEVFVATSGEEAIANLESFAPDLVLVDHMLPGADGLETAKLLKSQRPQITIALMSADLDQLAARPDLGDVVDALIPKAEITPARLLLLVDGS